MNANSNKIKQEALKYITISNNRRKYDIVFNPKEEKVKVNKKAVDIQIEESDDGFTYILFKNKKYLVEILDKNQNKYSVLINGVSYDLCIETPISYKRKKHLEKNHQGSKTEQILAPMPGKIVDVLVDENTSIKEGDSIIILEAMKMQNEILSHVSGKVSKINIKAEDAVMKDDVLLEIQK